MSARRWYRYWKSQVRGPLYVTVRELEAGSTIDWSRVTIITDDDGIQIGSSPGPNKPGHVGLFRTDTPPTLLTFLKRIYE